MAETLKGTRTIDVAIIGMAGRFPGADGIDAFWRRILEAEPAELTSLGPRWGMAREHYFSEDPSVPDRTSLDRAFCLPEQAFAGCGVDRQLLFGQRVVEEALNEAGPSGLSPREVALVCGTSWSGESYFEADVAHVFGHKNPPPGLTPEAQLEALAPLSRIGGPRLAVDTACASSLYAIDVAIGLLQQGMARRVVVLGLNAALPPWLFVGFTKLGATSVRAEIKPFAKDASGIVPGECAACVVLERLDDARGARRRVHAIIRNVGLSADGANRSVFAPAEEGQALAYERAYSGLEREVDYLEAHGTATTVGDEVELSSLDRFFRTPSMPRIPLGSVKALVGHTLAAAGLASLIKAVLILQKRTVPPHIHVDPNPRLAETCLELPAAQRALTRPAHRPLRVGVSSFGFGGANAHLVLEEELGQACAQPQETSLLREPLAILDMELALGPCLGAKQASKVFDEPSQFAPPSSERFWFAHAAARHRLGDGLYLPSSFEIDAKGLRMGPNFLKRLDAMQLLLLELARRITSRTAGFASQARSATVISNSMGGEKSTALARRHAALVQGGPVAFQEGEMTLEHIASSLPTMASGYPAYHFNARGFHETLCGGSSTFLTSLLLAPYWLSRDTDQLLLGAGRLFKGPLDVEACAAATVAQAEGAGLFLVQRLSHAEQSGARILGVIRGLFTRDEARSAQEAAALLGIDAKQIDRVDVCQLDPQASFCEGSAQQRAGFLAEAVGIECLARALSGPAQLTIIEVRHQGTCVLTCVVERRGELPATQPAPIIPLEVLVTPQPRAPHSVQNSPLTPLHAASPLPFETSTEPDALRGWLHHTSSVMRSYFAAQRAALSLLKAREPHESTGLSAARRPKAHLCIERVHRGPDGSACAELLVQDEHPYYFDHPLDHVPGILLVEGLQQLAETSLETNQYVSGIELRFTRFCDKQAPTYLTLMPLPEVGYQVRIEQGGKPAALGKLYVSEHSMQALAPTSTPAPWLEADPSLLHKHRPENVLVSPMRRQGQHMQSHAQLPPPGHALSAGDAPVWSITYVLEVARQALMQAAHGALGIPRDKPMNLISFSVSLSAPLVRGVDILLSIAPQKPLRVGDMLIADIPIRIESAGRIVGEAKIKAQVVDPQTYQEQRWQP